MEAEFVYRFHIALRGVSPKIWRRVELTAGSSLADVQCVIQISLGWSDEIPPRTDASVFAHPLYCRPKSNSYRTYRDS
jgi:Plasmid pRiA4b ORF-3-like protein